MGSDLGQGQSGFGVGVEHASYEVFCLGGYGHLFGKLVVAVLDSSVGLFDGLGLEGRFANEDGIEYDPQRPDISFKAMPGLSKYFRSNIVGGPTSSIPPISRMCQFSTQPKIPNFNLHLIIQKNIAQFDISMHHPLLMQVLNSADQLQHVAFGLELGDPHPAFYKF